MAAFHELALPPAADRSLPRAEKETPRWGFRALKSQSPRRNPGLSFENRHQNGLSAFQRLCWKTSGKKAGA